MTDFLELARRTSDAHARKRHLTIAQHYRSLAEAEERSAEQRGAQRRAALGTLPGMHRTTAVINGNASSAGTAEETPAAEDKKAPCGDPIIPNIPGGECCSRASMGTELVVGDLVRLKSGGHSMTVWELHETHVICVWSEGNKAQRERFTRDELCKSGYEEDPSQLILRP